jgi:hypothetical protein
MISQFLWIDANQTFHPIFPSSWHVVAFHYNARLHATVLTWALLERFNCELLDYPPYSSYLTPNIYHPFTFWRPGCLHSGWNNELMAEGTGDRLLLTHAHENLFPNKNLLIPTVTTSKSRLSVFVFLHAHSSPSFNGWK